jgi:hypothetical protein
VLERINFQESQRIQEHIRKILGIPVQRLLLFSDGYLMENLPYPYCQSETPNAIYLAFLMVFLVFFPLYHYNLQEGYVPEAFRLEDKSRDATSGLASHTA